MAVPALENRASYLLLWLYFVNSVFIFKYDRHLVKFSACIYIISTSTYLHICLHNILIMAASFYWFVKIPHPTFLGAQQTSYNTSQKPVTKKFVEWQTTIPSSHFFWPPQMFSSLIIQLKMPWSWAKNIVSWRQQRKIAWKNRSKLRRR